MKIGLLETGEPPEQLQPEFGRYGAMFQDLLGSDHDYVVYDVRPASCPPIRPSATPMSSPARRPGSMTTCPGSSR